MKLTKRESAFLKKHAPTWHKILSRDYMRPSAWFAALDGRTCLVGEAWGGSDRYSNYTNNTLARRHCNKCHDIAIDFFGAVEFALHNDQTLPSGLPAIHELIAEFIPHIQKAHPKLLEAKK